MQFPIAISVTSPLLSFPILISHFHTPHVLLTNLILELSFTPTSTVISLISSLSFHDYLYRFLLLLQTWTFCCVSLTAIVSRAFMHDRVTYELSTFHLRLRDTRLSPVTPTIFLQTFAPAVILSATKVINLVDFAQGKCHFLS